MTGAGTRDERLLVVVGAGGVGKTTLAAGLATRAARAGHRTLVITFDPSRRLAALLGVDAGVADDERGTAAVRDVPGLHATLVDARATFDRVVEEHAPDRAAARRILENRYYDRLAGRLAGVFEYMAVERLFELHADHSWDRIVLDTPPARNALDLLDAPDRIVEFVSSGISRFAARDWFDDAGHLRGGPLGRGVESIIESTIGIDLVRDVTEFFSAFRPLFEGFRSRAETVRALLRAPGSSFLLVTRAGSTDAAGAMRFARGLDERGLRLSAIVANRVHPAPSRRPRSRLGPLARLADLAERDAAGVARLEALLSGAIPLAGIPLGAGEPLAPDDLADVAAPVEEVLAGWP